MAICPRILFINTFNPYYDIDSFCCFLNPLNSKFDIGTYVWINGTVPGCV